MMVRHLPVTDAVVDERSKSLLFALIAAKAEYPEFKFAEILRLWFSGDVHCLAAFLAWLDAHGLEIRRKEK